MNIMPDCRLTTKKTGRKVLSLILASMEIDNSQEKLGISVSTTPVYGSAKVALPHIKALLQSSSLALYVQIYR